MQSTAAAAPVPTLPFFSLAGKTAVVTGGARGLGLAMSNALVLSGANLAIVDLNVDEAARQAQAITKTFSETYPDQKKHNTKPAQLSQPRKRPPKVTAHHADVSSKPAVDAALAEILTAHAGGPITNLIACAGFCENTAAIDFPPERIRRMLAVNVEGTYHCATAVAKHMMARGTAGNMVFVGSISGSVVNYPQRQSLYNASKAAVRHLAASLAVEWAGDGIRVNCLSPGYMLTEVAMNAPILKEDPGLKARWEAMIPLGEMGAPEDLMGTVVFLSSDASRYITGQEIKVDGGYTVC
ncbi:d-arabinitol dehydrogenase [Diplodia corticola]|uniref:D-arabinitol dehydrogenase n=1 Tax=Diplodia corticola TaxID=236234 RepID=A0A1J9QM61_9PEZI|nr:d-arabinitol dehydrogenase [Diplodia corticola]OJD29998.1 d-arabinitol dehydrogenase [Diplodia corticola]